MSDSWISWNPRIDEPSKPWPSSNVLSLSTAGGDRDVLHDAGQVAEAEVDELDPSDSTMASTSAGCALCHVILLMTRGTCTGPRWLGRQVRRWRFPGRCPYCERPMNWRPILVRSGRRIAKTRAMERQQDYVLRSVEERGVRLIRLWFTDVLGQLKSFAISPAELENALEEGMTFDGSSIDGFSRVQESDVLARPDPNSFELLPVGRSARRPRPGCSATSSTSTARRSRAIPARCCSATSTGPASGASRSTSRPRWSSSTSRTAIPTSRPMPLDNGSLLRPHHRRRGRRPAQAHRSRRSRRWASPSSTRSTRTRPSQHEIDLRHTDALTMADNVMTFRLVVREAAAAAGRLRHVHAQAARRRAGLGHAHPHVASSRATRTRSTTPAIRYKLSKIAQGFIAGLLVHAPRDHRRSRTRR